LDREEPARGRLDTGRIEGVEAEELGHRRGPRGWECSSTARRRPASRARATLVRGPSSPVGWR